MTTRERRLVAGTVLVMSLPLALVMAMTRQQPLLSSAAYEWSRMPVTPTAVGEKRTVLDGPTHTLANLEIHVTTLNPGEFAHAAHQHPEEELMVVQEGTVQALVQGAFTKVGPGSVIFQAPNLMHSIQNVGRTRAVYHVIKWRALPAAAQKP
ncbi:cupin domain-containing protein [Hymenobacter sp. BT491]|uniref:cupin domain-containing protein n=1 Tax=Hymenobacter sp. BT491 TaxID=2766779 RepID=UPI001653CBBA|nr:cupin domain-containing protein [Hymenobacter sp. BT491]MBC6988676.1 cupin domain-containing protein [Hymenobacter sp. BT491]